MIEFENPRAVIFRLTEWKRSSLSDSKTAIFSVFKRPFIRICECFSNLISGISHTCTRVLPHFKALFKLTPHAHTTTSFPSHPYLTRNTKPVSPWIPRSLVNFQEGFSRFETSPIPSNVFFAFVVVFD